MRFMITGGAGFIGSHIAEEAIKAGHEVVVVDNLVAGSKENLLPWWDPKRCTFIRQSVVGIMDSDLRGIDAIFHEACSKCRVSFDIPYQDLYTNAYETMVLADLAAAKGIPFIHASTGSVYGEPNGNKRTTEDAPKKPVSFYGVSKLAAENYLEVLRNLYGLKYVVLRYHHVYGPRQSTDPVSGGVVSIFINNLLKGEPITIYGSGKQIRHFTYVKDVVAANFAVAFRPDLYGRVFNLANPDTCTVEQLARLIIKKIGVSEREFLQYAPARPGDIFTFNVDSRALSRAAFGRYTKLAIGLDETINHYRDALKSFEKGSDNDDQSVISALA